MTVVLVPRKPDGGPRDRAWAYVEAFLGRTGWPVYVGENHAERFNKAAAINQAAERAGDWSIAMMVDADSFCDVRQMMSAARLALRSGRMTIAHSRVHYLSKAGTEQILDGYQGSWRPFVVDTLKGGCSSVIAIPRRAWDLVGGFDERFSGWGEEDVAFSLACQRLAGGIRRVPGDAWHLWHPTVDQERNLEDPGYQANLALREQYRTADRAEMRRLVSGDSSSTIPRRLVRTVPTETSDQVEGWWDRFAALHPGWQMVTHRDPIDPARFPLTAKHWNKCSSGAQKAGLIRLEDIWQRGGIYIDSDVEPYRSFEPLLSVPLFAAWEDTKTIPDAVFGAEPEHPAVRLMLDEAIKKLPKGPWESGPGVFTRNLPGRTDVLLLPPDAFYDVHYSELDQMDRQPGPWTFARHRYHGSWLTPEQIAANQK